MKRLEIVILGKPGCCLCDQAKEIATRLRNRIPFELRVLDVLADDTLRARYEFEVPVVFLQDRKIFKYQVREADLEQKLLRELDRAEGAGGAGDPEASAGQDDELPGVCE